MTQRDMCYSVLRIGGFGVLVRVSGMGRGWVYL